MRSGRSGGQGGRHRSGKKAAPKRLMSRRMEGRGVRSGVGKKDWREVLLGHLMDEGYGVQEAKHLVDLAASSP